MIKNGMSALSMLLSKCIGWRYKKYFWLPWNTVFWHFTLCPFFGNLNGHWMVRICAQACLRLVRRFMETDIWKMLVSPKKWPYCKILYHIVFYLNQSIFKESVNMHFLTSLKHASVPTFSFLELFEGFEIWYRKINKKNTEQY